MRDVDRLLAAGHQVVVPGDVGAVVADVAEEAAERAVVVEAERQRADLARGGPQLDGHVHRDAELGVDRPLHRVVQLRLLAGLVLEQVDRVRGVVPQQVVCPAAGLPGRVHVRPAEEVGLHVHLLDGQLAGQDAAAHPLVGRVEPASVPDHAGPPGLPLHAVDFLRVRPAVRHRNLHLHVLARSHRGDGLARVQLRRRAQDDGVHVVAGQDLVQAGRRPGDAVLRATSSACSIAG